MMNSPQLQRLALWIYDHEARKDQQGNLKVYTLPANDGGGAFEVAGITDRFDHEEVMKIIELVKAKSFIEAKQACCDYYITNTNPVATWCHVPCIEAFLRDTMFNRGGGGAAGVVQIAVGTKVDRAFGPVTKRALEDAATVSPANLLAALRGACDVYEDRFAGARPNLRRGLINRWNDRLAMAKSFL